MNKKFKEIIRAIKNLWIGLKDKKKEWGIFFTIICVIAVIFIMLFFYTLSSNKVLYYIILFLIIILHVIMMLYAIYNIFKPSNNEINTDIDNKILSELISLNKDELELRLLELKYERNCLEKRLLIVMGPIEKIGMLPSLSTLIVALSKIAKQYNWVIYFTVGYLTLLFFSSIVYKRLLGYDKLISLIEFAKKNK